MIEIDRLRQSIVALKGMTLLAKADYAETVLIRSLEVMVNQNDRLNAIEAALERGRYSTG